MNNKDKGKRERKPEVIVRKGYLKNHQTMAPERMFTEDLAALEQINEDHILDELQERLLSGSFHTFIGDILLICNPNEKQDIYNMNVSINRCVLKIYFIYFTNTRNYSTIPSINASRVLTTHRTYILLRTVPIRIFFIMKSRNTFYLPVKATPVKPQT